MGKNPKISKMVLLSEPFFCEGKEKSVPLHIYKKDKNKGFLG